MSLKIYNTSILTSFGCFTYEKINEEEAKNIINNYGDFTSAIGHQATAEALTEILGQKVEVNRIFDKMKSGDEAIIFKLNGRLPEGQILTRQELDKIGWSLGLLRMNDSFED